MLIFLPHMTFLGTQSSFETRFNHRFFWAREPKQTVIKAGTTNCSGRRLPPTAFFRLGSKSDKFIYNTLETLYGEGRAGSHEEGDREKRGEKTKGERERQKRGEKQEVLGERKRVRTTESKKRERKSTCLPTYNKILPLCRASA